jgi:hypothetical protein
MPEPDRCASKAKSTYITTGNQIIRHVNQSLLLLLCLNKKFSAKTSTKAISMKNGFPRGLNLIFPRIE